MFNFDIKNKKTHFALFALTIAVMFFLYGIFLIWTRGFAIVNALIIGSIIVVNIMLFLVLFLKKDETKPPKFIFVFAPLTYIAYCIALFVLLIPIISFSIFHKQVKENDKIDYIIVHGSVTNGRDAVTEVVYERLDKALEVIKQHDEARIVLSGGRMNLEKDSEAKYMANYLIEHGVDKRRLLLEDKSYNTYTNVDYSLNIIQEDIVKRNRLDKIINFPFDSHTKTNIGPEDTTLAYLSSDFHLYRIYRMSEKLGYKKAYYIGANTNILYKPLLYLKECLSFYKAHILGQV